MSRSKRPAQPLDNDPSRVAVPSLQGYAYQIWWSVYEWLMLGPNDVLYVEGAEDIDLLRAGDAETIQVKHSPRRISLSSKSVLEAISNFWNNQKRNPDYRVSLRFVTTAERTREKNRPFGNNRGLDYWDTCRMTGASVAPITEFLGKKDSLPRDLRDFLAKAEPETLREQFISRIQWDTGKEPRPMMEELVLKKVIAYGARVHDCPPDESRKIVPKLLQTVWEACDKKDRRLMSADFDLLFEAELTTRVPSRELLTLRRMAAGTRQYSPEIVRLVGVDPGRVPTPALHRRLNPPPFETVVSRSHLVSELRDTLTKTRALILCGSTGMGKSTLGRLVFQGLGEVQHVDFDGRTPESIRYELDDLIVHFSGENLKTAFLLDNLNFLSKPIVYESSLAEFLYALRLGSSAVVLTTQTQLPFRVALTAGLTAESFVNVPAFTEGDVFDLLVKHNGPAGSAGKRLARFVRAITGGHPQLCHARLRSLESKHWPSISLKAGFETADLEAVQKDARTRLEEEFPSTDARTLLYRLSVFTHAFRREHALRLASAMDNAADILDQLVGPWIELQGEGYYRLSPLLRGVAAQVFTPEDLRTLNSDAAVAILKSKTLTELDFSGAIINALAGQAGPALLVAVRALGLIPDEHQVRFAESLRVAMFVGTNGQPVLPTDPIPSLMFRVIQHKVAYWLREFDQQQVVEDAWEIELAKHEKKDGEEAKLLRFVLCFNTLVAIHAPFRSKLLDRLVEFHDLLKEPRIPDDMRPVGDAARDVFGSLLEGCILRCKTMDDVAALLSALGTPERYGLIIAEFRTNESHALNLMDRLATEAGKAAKDQRTRFYELTEQAIKLGEVQHMDALVATAFRARAAVAQEYDKDPEEARRVLAEGTKRLGRKQVLIQDYLGKILLNSGQDESAAAVWEELFPQWQNGPVVARIYAYRDAAVASAQASNWSRAANWALEGMTLAEGGGLKILAAALCADSAFAFWKAKAVTKSVEQFANCLRMLEKLPSPSDSPELRILSKLLGHTIIWIVKLCPGNRYKDTPVFTEPRPGVFSELRTSDDVEVLPGSGISLLWLLLCEVEQCARAGDSVWKTFVQNKVETLEPQFLFQYTVCACRRALQGDLERLVREFRSSFQRVIDLGGLLPPELTSANGQRDFLLSMLCTAAILEAEEGTLSGFPSSIWKNDAAGFTAVEQTWFDEMGRVQIDPAWAQQSMTDAMSDPYLRLIACSVLADGRRGPEATFYAHSLLASSLHVLWRDEIEDPFEKLVTRTWREIVTEQKASLRSPGVTCGSILAACDAEKHGMERVAEVLLAAELAVSVRLPAEVVRNLRKLAGRA